MSDTTKFPVDRLEVGASYDVSGNLMRLIAINYDVNMNESYLALAWAQPSGWYSTMSIEEFLAKNPRRVNSESVA